MLRDHRAPFHHALGVLADCLGKKFLRELSKNCLELQRGDYEQLPYTMQAKLNYPADKPWGFPTLLGSVDEVDSSTSFRRAVVPIRTHLPSECFLTR